MVENVGVKGLYYRPHNLLWVQVAQFAPIEVGNLWRA